MATKSCKVTIRDMEGVDHIVHVTASGLYEAIALGLASLRGEDWVAGISTGMNEIKVSVVNVPVEHSVKMHEFNMWLGRPGRTPKERMDRVRVREILGLA
jgi:hypothetical protein